MVIWVFLTFSILSLHSINGLFSDSGLICNNQISIGEEIALFLNEDSSTITSWGSNTSVPELLFGQTNLASYQFVPDQKDPVRMIGASGKVHACYLLNSGYIKCWGNNEFAQLGRPLDEVINTSTSVQVNGIVAGNAIATGDYHSCVIVQSGKYTKCWGRNNVGQLGRGFTGDPLYYTDRVKNIPSWSTTVSCAGDHCCVLTTAKTVWCWGGNLQGQLGSGWVSEYESDVVLATGIPESVQKIDTARDHTCALGESGQVYCWGLNVFYNDTNSSIIYPSAQTITSLGSDNLDITTPDRSSCVIDNNGFIKCIGEMSPAISEAAYMQDVGIVVYASASGSKLCAVAVSDKVTCWGSSEDSNNHSILSGGILEEAYIPLTGINATDAVCNYPTASPTMYPTDSPTKGPTKTPTNKPTNKPTQAPTKKPTDTPTMSPTDSPTKSPTKYPTLRPTDTPTLRPTLFPTDNPTLTPTKLPTSYPSFYPTIRPTPEPTRADASEATIGFISIGAALGLVFLFLGWKAYYLRKHGYMDFIHF